MKEYIIKNIEIKTLQASGFHCECEGICHEKILHCLSVVQALEGSYDIRLNNGDTFSTGEGGTFIAPSHTLQEITHHHGKNGKMKAHWVFLDVIVNDTFRFDDVFSFPVISHKRYDKELYSYPPFARTRIFFKILETFIDY